MENLRELIEGCISGRRQSQNELYQSLAGKMFVVCQRYSKNREEAQDILQEGFVRVFTYIHQYKFNGSFEGWVRRIMVNCALQKFRVKKDMHAVLDIEKVSIDNYETENILSRIGAKELMEMVQKLSPAYRTIFNLYVFEGMKHREIADLLGISEGTSKSNLSDARSILKKAIQNSMLSENKNINEV